MKIFEISTLYGRFETHNQKPPIDVIELQQIHSNAYIQVSDNSIGIIGSADGLISTRENKRTLAIKTADCLAILIEGEHGVSLIHVGWRGLALGILAKDELKKLSPLKAFFSPCISSLNYEVSEDFTQNFPNSDFFTRRDGKLFWSLENEACDQLRIHFPHIEISLSGICTFHHSQLHSYRRDKTNQRNWNIFIPKLK